MLGRPAHAAAGGACLPGAVTGALPRLGCAEFGLPEGCLTGPVSCCCWSVVMARTFGYTLAYPLQSLIAHVLVPVPCITPAAATLPHSRLSHWHFRRRSWRRSGWWLRPTAWRLRRTTCAPGCCHACCKRSSTRASWWVGVLLGRKAEAAAQLRALPAALPAPAATLRSIRRPLRLTAVGVAFT